MLGKLFGFFKNDTYISARQREDELPIKPSWSPQRRVYGVYPVGGSNDHNLSAAVKTVHERQQGGHNGGVDLVLTTGTNGG